MLLHPLRDTEILCPMVSAHAAGCAVARNTLQEKLQHGSSSVVIVDADAEDEAREPVDEAVYNEFPVNETYESVS